MTGSIKPRVTVVIASANQAEKLRYAVESVLWQTFANFEVWVIGNACTDLTDQLMESFSIDPRIHWHNVAHTTGNQYRLINEGIRRARGEYIAYLNDEDLWVPYHLEELVDHLDNSADDIVFSVIQRVYSLKHSAPEIPLLPDLASPPQITAIIHRKNVIEKIGYWTGAPEEVTARIDFFNRAQLGKLKIGIVPVTTGLRFLWSDRDVNEFEARTLYMQRNRANPAQINRELTSMMIKAENDLYRLTKERRRSYLLSVNVQKFLIRQLDFVKRLFHKRVGENEAEQNAKELQHSFSGTTNEKFVSTIAMPSKGAKPLQH